LRLLAASRGAVAGCLGTFGQWLRVGSRRCCTFGIETDVHPIFTPQLDGMLGAIGTIPAAHIVGGAKLIASPAVSFRVPGNESAGDAISFAPPTICAAGMVPIAPNIPSSCGVKIG